MKRRKSVGTNSYRIVNTMITIGPISYDRYCYQPYTFDVYFTSEERKEVLQQGLRAFARS